jgi:NhaP-type Na+/H+ or K+/H+ antiporter
MAGSWSQVPVVALALLCFATAQWLGGSGFIASFAGGMMFGWLVKEEKEELLEAAEGTGDVLAMVTWFIFGAMFIGDSLSHPDWRAITYAVLSLSVIRMIPVFLSVSGAKMSWDTKLFLGWFGPRGLASIVFIVMVKQEQIPGTEALAQAVTWTVLLSVFAHGITANPLSAAYARRVESRAGAV